MPLGFTNLQFTPPAFIRRLYLPSTKNPRWPSSLLILIPLNGLLFFIWYAWGSSNLWALIWTALAIGSFTLFALVPQAFFRLFVERRSFLRPLPRFLLYSSPFWGAYLLAQLAPDTRPLNQVSPVPNPSGSYIATLDSSGSKWAIHLQTKDGAQKSTVHTTYGTLFSVYWAWDGWDRFWTYNSDDAAVNYAELKDGQWRQVLWGYSHTPFDQTPPGITPPPLLFPDYDQGLKSTIHPSPSQPSSSLSPAMETNLLSIQHQQDGLEQFTIEDARFNLYQHDDGTWEFIIKVTCGKATRRSPELEKLIHTQPWFEATIIMSPDDHVLTPGKILIQKQGYDYNRDLNITNFCYSSHESIDDLRLELLHVTDDSIEALLTATTEISGSTPFSLRTTFKKDPTLRRSIR